ncbi:MAG TPA: plasmid stabilization protein [Actinomycetota bacterium]
MPQRSWSAKDERKYEHIKKSQKDQGKSSDRAEEIAARTVNKDRAQEGRTKSSSRSSRRETSSSRRGGRRSGTNRPKGRTKEQLYNDAKRMGIEGRSKMTKQQLQRAVAGKKGGRRS